MRALPPPKITTADIFENDIEATLEKAAKERVTTTCG